uniref:Protein TolA n=1 Tax=Macrostomum lignano TaxID=282301 RepID=A0A1I8JDZ9_9PLAT
PTVSKLKVQQKIFPNRRCFQKLKRSNQTQRSASVMPKSSSVTRALTLLLMTACAQACSPKAVKSVFVGRAAAQAQHQAKKAKYLAGETQPLGQKLGLSRGGVIMENVGVDRLRSEIKYLEGIEKQIKQTKKQEIKLAQAVAKAEAKGKEIPKWAQKTMKAQEARRAEDLADAADKAKAAQRAAERAAREAQAKKGFFRKGKMPPPNPQPVPPPALVETLQKTEEATKKRRFFG